MGSCRTDRNEVGSSYGVCGTRRSQEQPRFYPLADAGRRRPQSAHHYVSDINPDASTILTHRAQDPEESICRRT